MRLDAVVLEAFGTPDVRQIDGLGSADPLTMTRRRFRALISTTLLATSALAKIEGTIIHEIYGKAQPGNPPTVRSGHPTGTLQVEIVIEEQNGQLELTKAALARTARLLMDGNVYVR